MHENVYVLSVVACGWQSCEGAFIPKQGRAVAGFKKLKRSGDVIGMLVDMEAGALAFSLNGELQGACPIPTDRPLYVLSLDMHTPTIWATGLANPLLPFVQKSLHRISQVQTLNLELCVAQPLRRQLQVLWGIVTTHNQNDFELTS